MASSRCCSHFGDGPFLTPRTSRSAKPGQRSGASIVTLTGVSPLPGTGFDRRRLQPAEAGRGKIARDAVDAGGVGAVRRQVDLDDRIVELGVGGKAGAHRRIGGQVDDAVMLFRKLQLALRAHHAVAFDAADLADGKRHVDAGHIGAGRRKGADEARARIGRAADDLHRLAVAGVDGQHLQLVGVGVSSAVSTLAITKGFSDDLSSTDSTSRPIDVSRSTISSSVASGVEMILEPGKGEFHVECPSSSSYELNPPNKVGMSSGRKP